MFDVEGLETWLKGESGREESCLSEYIYIKYVCRID